MIGCEQTICSYKVDRLPECDDLLDLTENSTEVTEVTRRMNMVEIWIKVQWQGSVRLLRFREQYTHRVELLSNNTLPVFSLC